MSSNSSYDLVVLGGGAAAFAALTEASSRGLSTALVNTGLPLGGTCVNVGCVPSKHLLEVGKMAFEPPRNPFKAVRYEQEPEVDWATAIDEKNELIASLREQNYVDVADHFDVDVYEGFGQFATDTSIEIGEGDDVGVTLSGEKILVATGSSPKIAPIDGIESVEYETSESILERRELPESVIMLGGGYIGLEWGQILHRAGVDVTILQRSAHVLSGMDSHLGREVERTFEEEGIRVVTGASFERVGSVTADGGQRSGLEGVFVEATVDGDTQRFEASDLFVATGVKPNSEGIGLDEIGVERDETGAIVVDDFFQTTNQTVYAAGDVIGEPMLETVAAKEGNHAVKNAFGDEGQSITYRHVPEVVFTSPEVASVGITEAEYMEEHGTCSCRTVLMKDESKSKAVKDTRGLVQVVKHHETDEIVGVHMVAPRAADMIAEATLAVQFGLTVDDIIDTIHPFPTFSEAFKHACQSFRRDMSKMSCCVE
ncbi:mercury(II) reductase [Haladaptatus sp. DJG-WS-42]|uniref:mercury(II) reductase n=1 Tax=Haladaptatus sp. DJG-WS-42 TaxID=3120516 RepID=UPI0030D02A7C